MGVASVMKLHDPRDEIGLLGQHVAILADASEPIGNRPEEYAAFIGSEITKWRAVIKQANMKPD